MVKNGIVKTKSFKADDPIGEIIKKTKANTKK